MDYLIRTAPNSLEKPYCFYAEPIRNGSSAHHLTASTLKCWRKKQVPAAICITFHTNFTIRPSGHSNFCLFRAARRLRSNHRKRYFLGKVCGPANINFTGKEFMKMLAKYGKMNSHILKLEDKLPM